MGKGFFKLEMKMKTVRELMIVLCGGILLTGSRPDKLPENELWYRNPANVWTEALPIGNGRLGAMVYGGISLEHLQFNEETLWDGYPRDHHSEGASEWLPVIRQLLFDGKQAEAEKLAQEKFMGKRAWEDDYQDVGKDRIPPFPPRFEADYQPFGDVFIRFPGHGQYTNYRRSLDISKALVHVSYLANGVRYTREYFASHPGELIAIRLTSEKKGSLTFSVKFSSPHPISDIRLVDDQTLGLRIKVEDGVLCAEARLNVDLKGGKIKPAADSIMVTGADEAVLKLVAATSYVNYKDISADPEERCLEYMKKSSGMSYKEIRKEHTEDYTSFFNRFSIDLGGWGKRVLPTDERITGIKNGPDNDLAALYVQYSRYLLLSSSREGTYPPNLQGIWNDLMQPPWGSKYTTNINAEMNMWGAEILNLPECHQPFFRLTEEVAEEGRKTAQAHYNAKGWVLHHNTDLWRGTAPVNASDHGIWVTGGAWLCHHLWEHYQYSTDLDFLRNKAWPLIRESARFFVDFLVTDPRTGYLISTPSNSPETGGLVVGPTMDHAIIRSLFKIVIQCTEILNVDHEFAKEVKAKLEKLAPYQTGRFGQLQEWLEDKDDTTNKHRHVSHLWTVFPGSEITWDATPELMKAAKKSLIYRGDAGTGWSLAWKINYWARFREGDHAHKMVQMLLGPAEDPTRETSGGSYPNLLDAHPPFQIDGNFGGGAGIAEMLMQSHQGYIELLPALPRAWDKGYIRGMRARGGFEIDMWWSDYKITRLKIISHAGTPLRLKVNGKMIEKNTRKGELFRLNFSQTVKE